MHEGDHPARPLSCMLTQEHGSSCCFLFGCGTFTIDACTCAMPALQSLADSSCSVAAVGRVEAVADIAAPKRLGLFAWQLWKTNVLSCESPSPCMQDVHDAQNIRLIWVFLVRAVGDISQQMWQPVSELV